MRRWIMLLIVLIAISTTGCKTGDIWGTLAGATEYIAIVGQNMQARGWDFPADPVSWVRYYNDLKDSISIAKANGVQATGIVRDIEKVVIEADMPQLNEAFDSNPNW